MKEEEMKLIARIFKDAILSVKDFKDKNGET
jgi:hypothetical protein